MSLYCASCGSRNADDAWSCLTCGSEIDRTLVSSDATPRPGGELDAAAGSPSPLPPPSPPPSPPSTTPPRRRHAYSASDATSHVSPPPFRIYSDKAGLTVPLVKQFRFVHEPLPAQANASFVGRENELETLAERILFSSGGSFLVTGYRGVGKTSFVNQVVGRLKAAMPWAREVLGPTEIVDIYLNVARPTTPSELMHYIIRRLHDRLHECGIFDHLEAELREDLTLAYQRTSVNMARKTADTHERSFGVNEASLGGDWLKAAVKMSWTSKRSRTRNLEMSFLGYDDKAAEHDILRLAERLTLGYKAPESRWRRAWSAMRRLPASHIRLKIIFVFDELDKLEEFAARAVNGGKGKPAIDEILGSLKNLFTTSGISFIFVAGKDLQERWLEDVGRGDSVYESVFAYDQYLPCLWRDVGAICDGQVDATRVLAPVSQQAFDAFKKYLAYRGRGIPRRIIRTFNEYVEWDAHAPALAFTAEDVRRIRFFAGLQDLLDQHAHSLFARPHEEVVGTQSDRRRLGVYYLIDWVLRQGDTEFTLKDVLTASSRLSIKIALSAQALPRVSEELLNILLLGDYIQKVQRSVTQVFIGPANAEGESRYRVTPRRLVEMGAAAAIVDASPPFDLPSDPLPQREVPPVAIRNYRIVREVGRGGMGVVYEAIDERLDRRVAVKLLHSPLRSNPDMVARFEREAKILASLDHPNIVRLFDTGMDNGVPFVAMEFLEGLTLEEIIKRQGRLQLPVVAEVGARVAGAVGYVHSCGYVRNDIKPNNMMLTSAGRICLLDFGISRPRDRDDVGAGEFNTGTFILVGTPQYMAPEQLTGDGEDERSDIYALGVSLYRMLTGAYAYSGMSVVELATAQAAGAPAAPSRHADVPPAVDSVVLRCLARDPAARFQSMSELAAALARAVGASMPVDLKALASDARAEVKRVDAFDDMITHDAHPSPVVAGVTSPDITHVDASSRDVAEYTKDVPVKATGSGRGDVAQPQPRVVATPPPDASRAASRGGLDTPRRDVSDTGRVASVRRVDSLDANDLPPDVQAARPGLVLTRGSAKLVVTPQGEPRRSFVLTGDSTLGRSSENSIVLRDSSVSRYHAMLLQDDEGWMIEDANSSSGTFVAGIRLLQRTRLHDGDEITAGIFTFRFLGP